MPKTMGLQEVKTLGPQNREMDAMSGTLRCIPESKEQPGSSKPETSHPNRPHAWLASMVQSLLHALRSLFPGQHVLLVSMGTPPWRSCGSHGPSAGLALATGDGGGAS